MSESLHVPNPDALTHHLVTVVQYGEQQILQGHVPSRSPYWKALDLAHVALHLSGCRVWETESPTGGSSFTLNQALAKRYLRARGPLIVAAMEDYLGITDDAYPPTKVLVGLGERVYDHSIRATHSGNHSPIERIATSMRLTDLDEASQAMTRELFGLSATFDTEFVYGENSTNTPVGIRPHDASSTV